MRVFVLRVRVCTRVILFASSVNYLENWQCLSIVDGSGKYVSLGQLFWWKLISAPFCLENKKVVVGWGDSSHACHAFKRLLLPRACGGRGGGRGDGFQIWHVGCWTGNLLLPPHSGPLTRVIPNICVEPCAFFCLYPSSSLWLSRPLSLPSKHPGQSASLLLRSFSVSFTEFSILQALSDRLLHFCPSVSP